MWVTIEGSTLLTVQTCAHFPQRWKYTLAPLLASSNTLGAGVSHWGPG